MTRPTATPTDVRTQIEDYAEGWYQMMTNIWRDRLDLLGVYDTGRLRQSVTGAGLDTGTDLAARFQFLEYGLYVDRGTGRGYTRGNGGNLTMLDRAYRAERGMGQPRRPRPWFSTSWEISRRVLIEQVSHIIGDQTVAALDLLE